MLASVLALTTLTGCLTDKPATEATLTYEELSEYAFDTLTLSSGINVNYRVQGEDNEQAIILIHGGGDSLSVWNQWADELKKKYKVVRLDMAGHGLTDPFQDGKYSTPRWAEFLNTFVNEYGLNDFILVGHSYGGEASLHYIDKYPLKVKALGLVAAGAYEPKWEDIKDYVTFINQEFPAGKEGVREGLKLMFADGEVIDDEIVNYSYELGRYEKNQGVLEAMERASMNKYQEVSNVDKIMVPTLLMWGDKDKLSSLKNIGQRLHREIPNSELNIYKNVGHMPNYSVAKQSVADFMTFLNRNL